MDSYENPYNAKEKSGGHIQANRAKVRILGYMNR